MQGLRAHCAIVFTTIGLASPLLLQASGLRVPIDNGLGVPGAAGGSVAQRYTLFLRSKLSGLQKSENRND